MEFNIDNVCKVNSANIVANGITVVAGYNDTGKSTVLKAIYVFLKTFGNKSKTIEDERWNSVSTNILNKQVIYESNDKIFRDFPLEILGGICHSLKQKVINVGNLNYQNFKEVYLNCINSLKDSAYLSNISEENNVIKDDFIKKLYSGIDEIVNRPLEVYFEYITKKNLNSVFGIDIGNLINLKNSFVISNDNNIIRKIEFNKDIIDVNGNGIQARNIVYIETKNLLDNYGNSFDKVYDVNRFLSREPQFDVYEKYKEIEKNKNILSEIFMEVLHGRLQKDDNRLQYLDENTKKTFSINNVASGMKTLLVLQRLVENGTLSEGSWLLIDEPESNLHPEWHVKMAEILILMKKEMNINIVVSSHSAYFIRALEVKLASYKMKNYGRFYLMQPNKSMYDAIDVSDNTEKIYQQLYRPLEDL